jgi:hypothetical protein
LPNRAVNCLPLNIRQHLLGHPELLQRLREGQTHGAAGAPAHHRGDHAVAGVVVDAGDHLGLRPVEQEDPTDDVHLPQLHWPIAFPADIVFAAPAASGRGHQPVADQDPVHRHPRRHRSWATMPAELEHNPAGTPLRVVPAHLTHQRLHLRRRLMSAAVRAPRPVLQARQSFIGIAAQPGMQALPGHSDLLGYLHDRIASQNRQHGLIPLFHDRHSHQCQSRLPDPVLPANNT